MKMKKAIHSESQAILDRLELNLARVRSLVAIYESSLAGTGKGRRGHSKTDVLRAATVLLHASVEDCLRSLAYWKWPLASSEVLDNIPLTGAGKATRFSLGQLAAHRGASVNDVINKSVDGYLERSNYNNTTEVATFLESLGIDPARVNTWFPKIDELMKRRHQIVHRADQDETGGPGNHAVRSIGRVKVKDWITAADGFCKAVLSEVPR